MCINRACGSARQKFVSITVLVFYNCLAVRQKKGFRYKSSGRNLSFVELAAQRFGD